MDDYGSDEYGDDDGTNGWEDVEHDPGLPGYGDALKEE